jgi:hypothetical protein
MQPGMAYTGLLGKDDRDQSTIFNLNDKLLEQVDDPLLALIGLSEHRGRGLV